MVRDGFLQLRREIIAELERANEMGPLQRWRARRYLLRLWKDLPKAERHYQAELESFRQAWYGADAP